MAFNSEGGDDIELGASDEINTIYGDMITFIMCLFILLFILSYNKKQDETFFTQMRIKFGAKQVEQEKVVTTEELLVSKIQGYIKKEKLENQTKVLVDEQKISLIMETPALFKSGSAELSETAKKSISKLAKVIGQVKNPIIVEGHTDNIPIKNDEFGSNWELSFYRAYSVVKYLIYQHKFSPKYLSAIGYGEYQPVIDNKTAANRAKNRRIAINIIRVSRAQAQP